MPNKRDKKKRGISVYVPIEIKSALVSEAERLKIPMSELITKFYTDALEARGYKLNNSKETDNEH